ncbi:thioredoxin [Microbacterium sp.]|uniref:thioredoxin n=1 Tax=Microbacterium sp. TaxID=51671 RepID=UPI003A88A83D
MAEDAGNVVVVCPACGTKNRVRAAQSGRVRCALCHADLPWQVSADDRTFAVVVEESSLPVLVDVWAPWCGPCRMVSPIVEQMSREFAGRLKVVKVNSDESPGVSRRHTISSIPTLLMYQDGKETARLIGAHPAPQLQQWVQQQLSV